MGLRQKKKLSLVTKRAEEKHSSATKRHERALSPLPSYIRPPSFTKKRRRVHESPPAPERYEKVGPVHHSCDAF